MRKRLAYSSLAIWLAAGSHTASVQSPTTANACGCGPNYGAINTIIFE